MQKDQNAKSKCKLFETIQTHKREIIILGISTLGGLGVYLLIRYQSKEVKDLCDALLKLLEKNKGNIEERIADTIIEPLQDASKTGFDENMMLINICKEPAEVNMYIRNLHEGWKASPEKLASAVEMGIQLLPGQTWVAPFIRNAA